ncbi:phosphoribosylglycinamide synthetase [Bifidobacterium sp. ESL0763]|uniref:phosphoribosylglycinamide synthetase n=1 Tax=Bifidobacterium sp. ESL0763 TaxID=2983227 RepID=UPI0035A84121
MDYALAKERGIDVDDPRIGLKIASERLAIVRYVFLVQVEDGIATADQRACLEYADAVLIGWPEMDADDVVDPDESGRRTVADRLRSMEGYIARFSAEEAAGHVDTMADLLVRATKCVAAVRRLYQPDFPIPTYAEIRHVVQGEWDDDMDKIDLKEPATTVEAIEQETEKADEQRDTADDGGDQANKAGKAGKQDGSGKRNDGKREGK